MRSLAGVVPAMFYRVGGCVRTGTLIRVVRSVVAVFVPVNSFGGVPRGSGAVGLGVKVRIAFVALWGLRGLVVRGLSGKVIFIC